MFIKRAVWHIIRFELASFFFKLTAHDDLEQQWYELKTTNTCVSGHQRMRERSELNYL